MWPNKYSIHVSKLLLDSSRLDSTAYSVIVRLFSKSHSARILDYSVRIAFWLCFKSRLSILPSVHTHTHTHKHIVVHCAIIQISLVRIPHAREIKQWPTKTREFSRMKIDAATWMKYKNDNNQLFCTLDRLNNLKMCKSRTNILSPNWVDCCMVCLFILLFCVCVCVRPIIAPYHLSDLIKEMRYIQCMPVSQSYLSFNSKWWR